MPLELEQIKKLHDKAYTSNQITRERASNDLVFYWITQWDDTILQESQLSYRGEFNILRKAGRQILSDLAENPVQVDFEPINETSDDSAELADGLYRAGLKKNTSIEAFNNSETESVVCGQGAWLLYTKYESKRSENSNQIICRKPIYEANNTVFWDPNSRSLDKADAKYCSILTAYSEDGYKDLVKELTGKEPDDVNPSNFKTPEHSYTFPWIHGKDKKIYVVAFYHITEESDKILVMTDPFGDEREIRAVDIKDIEDEMIDYGYSIESEYTIKRKVVTKYIASGEDILKTEKIAGENIPVIPAFGEHAVVEGEEHWEGITRLAKDPSKLRNFAFSYLADIFSRSPREKPIFYPEQVAGHEDMYSEAGIDNNYPFLYGNRKAGDGADLPLGPVSTMPAPNIPPALPLVLSLTREATEDVANPGLPQDIADPDLSGKAVLALEARIDKQSLRFRQGSTHSKRRDGEVWASMASEITDTPRKTTIELPDGTRKQVQIMEQIQDEETGDIVTVRDLRNSEFEVYSKIGPSYSSQKEQTIEVLERMIALMDINDPVRKAMQLKVIALVDGADIDDIKEFVNKQLVLSGVKKPDTPEEEQMLAQQQQQGDEPDAATLLAIAENKKGDADLLAEQRKGIEMQMKARNDEMQTLVKQFEAITERMAVQVDAQEAKAKINNTNIDTFGKQIDNVGKFMDLSKLEDKDLYEMLNNEHN